MANNYLETSTMVSIPDEQLAQAELILEAVEQELEADEEQGYVDFCAELRPEGLWIHGDESINTDHVELLMRRLVEELKLPGIHVCSFCYTCSKPRIDEFGGGAFAVALGQDTIWCDAAHHVTQEMEKKLNENK